MPPLKNHIIATMNAANAAFRQFIGMRRNDDELAAERAAYAEIGRIVAIPFSVADVYERFADQVAKIIPFDGISITHLDQERDSFTIMYVLGMDVIGLGQGETISLKGSVVSVVAGSKQAIRTDQHPSGGSAAQSLVEAGLLCRIATPLIANEQVVGTLHLSSSVPDVYGEAELARLEIVGNQIAGAIASAILLQAERDRASQLESLYQVAAILAQPLSFEAKAQKIVDTLVLIAEADHVVLRRHDDKFDDLILVASAGSESVNFQPLLKLTDANLSIFKAYLSGQPSLINDYRRHQYAQPNLLALGVESMFFMPIRSENRTMGALSVFSMDPDHFTDSKVALITAFSNEIGSLFNSREQAAKIQESQEAALEKERRNSRQQSGLFQISRIYAGVGDFKEKATAALEILVNLASADWTTLRLAKDSEPGLHLAAAAGPAVEKSPPLPLITKAQIISTRAFTEGRIIVTDDYATWPAASQFLLDVGMKSLVCLPIKVSDRTLGLVTLISKKRNAFNPELVDLLASVVEGLGNLLEISILHDESEVAHRELERLTEALSRSNQQIIQSNQLLEERVQIRTQELEAARERAMRSEKLAIIGQLSGGIAHDLRNPLGAIENAAYLINRKFEAEWSTENKEKIAELLELMSGEIARANDVISNLLSFGSNREIAFSQIEIGDVIDDSMASFVLHENIDLSITIESKLPPVLGEASHLIRALQNLVANAQDAMENGGRLRIDACGIKGSVEIVISDTGSGIDPKNIDRIFDPLYSEKFNGTGLGLAICQEIINKHNGSISVESKVGTGTSFTIRIPFAVQDGRESEKPALV